MQLTIAALIIGSIIVFVGAALLSFIKMDMRNKMAQSELRRAATDLLESDNKPTKMERAIAEAQAKAKLKLALKQYEARLNEMFEVNAKS